MMSEKIRWRLFLFFLYISHATVAQEVDEYLLWANVSNYPDYTNAVVNQSDLDANRNLYVIGSYLKKFPLDPDPSQTNDVLQIFLRKFDTNGNLIWSKEFGNETYYSYAGDIRVDNQGDIVITGYLLDLDGITFGQPVNGFFLAKLDSDGNLIWISPFTKTSISTWGAREASSGKQSKMEIDLDNSIVLYSNGNPHTQRNSTSGLYISRYSSDGMLTHQYQITQNDNVDSPNIGGLAIDQEGNFIVTGSYHVSLQIGPVLFGTPGSQSNQNVQLFLAKFSATGVLMWAKNANGLSIGNDVEVDELGNLYLTGLVPSHTTLNGEHVLLNETDYNSYFIAKLNSNGQPIWSRLIRGASLTGLKRTIAGDFYISGECNGFLEYDNITLTRPNQYSSMVLKINTDLSFGGAMVSEGPTSGSTYRIAYNSSVDDDGNIYTIGNYSDQIIFGCDTLGAMGTDMFVTKYSSLPPVYTLDISGPVVLCSGTPLSLVATTIPEPVKYYWTLPVGVSVNNQVQNQLSADVSADANGQEIDVSIRKGCYNYSSSGTYKIKIDIVPEAAEVLGQQEICNPGATRFYCTTSSDASFFVWELPTGITPILNTLSTTVPYIDVLISNEFEQDVIKVKAANDCFESEISAGKTVQLIKAPSPVSFVNVISEFCNQGQTELFEVTESVGADLYIWTIPANMVESGIVTSSSNTIQLTFKNSNPGVLTVYAKNDCHQTEVVSYPITLTNPLPEPMILKSDCDLALTTTGMENIVWFKDQQQIEQGVTTVALSDKGEYYVTVTNLCGTVMSPVVSANPLLDSRLYIPNVITPDGDGKNDVLIINADVDDLSIELFNRWGKSVYQNTHYKNDWDGSGLNAGVYYYQVQHHCLTHTHKDWLQIIK